MFKTEKDFGGYWVKNIKRFYGHDGGPLTQCSVYKDSVKIGFFSEDSRGGPARLQNFSRQHEENLREFAKEYEKSIGEEPWAESYHRLVMNIVRAVETQKEFTKKCKTRTIFTLDEDRDAGYYYQWKIPYQGNEQRIKDYLDRKYPNQYVIVNEFV